MGGAERNLAQTAHALQARGLSQEVVCATDHGIWVDHLTASGIPVTILDIRSAADMPRALPRLVKLVNCERPRVLQGWMYHGNLLATLAHRLARGRRERRLFWNLRASNMDEGGYRRILRWSARLSAWPDMVLANSQTGLDFHIGLGYQAAQERGDSERNRHGSIQPKFCHALEAARGLRHSGRCVRRAARGAGQSDEGSRDLPCRDGKRPDMHGVLVGAGTETLNVPSNVRALGMRRDANQLYPCADVIVSTSAFGEGFSNVLAEGMSAGLVPVATDVGDAREIIGDTGYVISRRDPEMLAKTLGIESANMPTELSARGLKARARIVENFTLARAADRYERLYRHG